MSIRQIGELTLEKISSIVEAFPVEIKFKQKTDPEKLEKVLDIIASSIPEDAPDPDPDKTPE